MQAEALISRANRLTSTSFAQSNRKFWKYDWLTPRRPLQSQSLDKTANSDNVEEDKYSFQYKTWQPAENKQWEDLDDSTDDVLELTLYDRTRKVDNIGETGSAANGAETTDGLTVDDIRGAVGAEESIPGFSSSDAAAVKEKETAATGLSTEPEISNNSEIQSSEDQKANQDADGDVKLY